MEMSRLASLSGKAVMSLRIEDKAWRALDWKHQELGGPRVS